jgi:hypothetical protein
MSKLAIFEWQLEAPDLDLIKQVEQGCGRFGKVDCAHLCAGWMTAATNAGVLLLICCRSSNGWVALQ